MVFWRWSKNDNEESFFQKIIIHTDIFSGILSRRETKRKKYQVNLCITSIGEEDIKISF